MSLSLKPATKPKRRHPEADHQRALFRWARLNERKYPELHWMFHVPNGEIRSKRTAAQLKAMGVKPGVLDIWLPLARRFRGRDYHGLAIELKAPGSGKPTFWQAEWIVYLECVAGYCALTAYGWEDARRWIIEYLSGRTSDVERKRSESDD